LIASVVALFRQDILATKFIAERIIRNIVGAATGKVSLLEDFFASLNSWRHQEDLLNVLKFKLDFLVESTRCPRISCLYHLNRA